MSILEIVCVSETPSFVKVAWIYTVESDWIQNFEEKVVLAE
jgi:hypothetical protein